ncbi:MAG: hydrogenase maturation protease [Anaerolineae bacterium]|jgi:hydrogenase maturation protease|nr:hydrogenase maturation protease [Anaerolineae bacterium]
MRRTLVIGYGNPYRRDDGVALHVANFLRATQGLRPLALDEDGLDDCGHPLDTVVLHQLLPEIAPMLADYDLVVFVDAHTGVIPDDVRVLPVQEEYGFQAVTHHMSPGMMLALARAARGRAPEAVLVSIRGEDFDFGDGLSAGCKARAETAVRAILDMACRE